ncbi:uncharacterized protein DUF3304 [Collimonas sp. PA-H2]|uniref:DUF3304 domain-containing protein n=1 Tax=Collimonas sp. PA-H2 TaxID=1881062 RepID=UPI000BF8D6CE|nr:DUF3304 domain-containing protein [Collimonas sp. PA-H2]PFH09752.1 uncharacterized protein DUF3304 [Collimonas sp. PA-H2]
MKLKQFVPLLFVLTLTACATPSTTDQKQADADQAVRIKKILDNYVPVTYVSISCVGHGDALVTGYSIQDLVSTREYGGGRCGGTNAAGYPLPKQWRPGMKVKVSWKLDGQPWRETTTNIMRYDKAGMVFIHIFNNNQVRVVSSAEYSSESPKHQIPPGTKIPPPEEQ